MKQSLILVAAVLLVAAFGCGRHYENQIKTAHDELLKSGQQFVPAMEQLTQLKNAVNIQGRALTQAEMDFAKAVLGIEESYSQWQKDVSTLGGQPYGKSRLAEEKRMLEVLTKIKESASKLKRP
jgi:hypothetical protein